MAETEKQAQQNGGEDARQHDRGGERNDDQKSGRQQNNDQNNDRKNDQKSDGENKNSNKDSNQDSKGQQRRAKWPFVVAGLVVAIFVGVVLWIIFRPRPDVWTNDAYVTAHFATIAPRIAGQVATVEVEDNQFVKAGQVLVTLDSRDNENAVATAEAMLERDRAQLAEISANVARQPAVIDEQDATVAQAKARLDFTTPDARRFTNLAASGAGTVQQHQQADSALRQSQAQLRSSQASLDASRRQLDVVKAQRDAAAATVKSDEQQLQQARLNLSYTSIFAPLDGMVAERAVQVGNTVAPGSTLLAVVPLERAYISSNYREVDLIHVRPGQHATIHLDAYDVDLSGTVDSMAPATGASFAPIQPNNATGNFTKIVQRLAVKITVDPDQPLARLLRVGFSVETTIHTGLENVVGEQRDSASPVAGH